MPGFSTIAFSLKFMIATALFAAVTPKSWSLAVFILMCLCVLSFIIGVIASCIGYAAMIKRKLDGDPETIPDSEKVTT